MSSCHSLHLVCSWCHRHKAAVWLLSLGWGNCLGVFIPLGGVVDRGPQSMALYLAWGGARILRPVVDVISLQQYSKFQGPCKDLGSSSEPRPLNNPGQWQRQPRLMRADLQQVTF